LGPILVLLALVWVRELWLPPLGTFLQQTDKPAVSQAIVPLAGERARVLFAAGLWHKGLSKQFIATNQPIALPGIEHDYAQLVALEARQQGIPTGAIIQLSRQAHSPFEEALLLRDLSLRKGWRSLLVVGSPFETRRIRLMYARVFAGTEVKVRVVAPPNNPGEWWKTSEGLAEVLGEYGKLLLAWVGYR
jgi:uncharacterized SAM-binding protein YcdF (DUF218 family)